MKALLIALLVASTPALAVETLPEYADDFADAKECEPLDDGRRLQLQLLLPREFLKPGSYRFHSEETLGVAGAITPEGGYTFLGLFGDGEVRLSRAGTLPGAAIAGELEAVLYQLACLGAGD